MKRLVAVPPLPVGFAVLHLHAVVAGQVFVQFVAEVVEPLPQVHFCAGERAGVHAELGLHFAEFAEGTVGDLGALLDLRQGQLLEQVGAQCPLHFLQRGEADQGVAGTDVEVDVGQRLDLFVAVQLCDEFQEQA